LKIFSNDTVHDGTVKSSIATSQSCGHFTEDNCQNCKGGSVVACEDIPVFVEEGDEAT
jgi:hypothetical protein